MGGVNNLDVKGCFANPNIGGGAFGPSSQAKLNSNDGVEVNASLSSKIYSKSSTVQPLSLRVISIVRT